MNKNYDICIVGTGPAGAFAANRLAKNNYNILVVEAGDSKINLNLHDNIDMKISSINGKKDIGFSQQIGGSSNLWTGGLAEMNSIDIETRKEFNFLSWPISQDQLRKYYKQVKKILNCDSEKREFNQIKDLDLREMIVMDRPYNTKYLFEGFKNLTLLKNHFVFDVILNKNNDSVEYLTSYNSKTKKLVNIYAKKYILAAGTINNIRILLNSLKEFKILHPHLFESIGSHISTHPKGYFGTISFKNSNNFNNPLLNIYPNKKSISRYYFGLNKKDLKKYNLLNHCLRVESIYSMRMIKILTLLKKIFYFLPFIFNKKNFLEFIVKLGIFSFQFIERSSPFSSTNKIYVIRGYLDQISKKENRIFLSQKLSISGLPLAAINWHYDDNDWNNIEKFMVIMKSKLKKEFNADLAYKAPKKEFIGFHSHFIGGTRIGESPNNSVVDKNLKVHNLKNLYISGPSVFPSFGYANPFLTISALSLRLADHLIES